MGKWFEVIANAEFSVSRAVEADSKEQAVEMVAEMIESIDGVYNISNIDAEEIED